MQEATTSHHYAPKCGKSSHLQALPTQLTLEYKTHSRCLRSSHSPNAETLEEPSSLSGVWGMQWAWGSQEALQDHREGGGSSGGGAGQQGRQTQAVQSWTSQSLAWTLGFLNEEAEWGVH